jgi:hypothetical protein
MVVLGGQWVSMGLHVLTNPFHGRGNRDRQCRGSHPQARFDASTWRIANRFGRCAPPGGLDRSINRSVQFYIVLHLFFFSMRCPCRRKPMQSGKRCQTACKPGSVPAGYAGDGHSSGTSVAGRLARPTRTAARKPACRPKPARRPYLVLLPVGFTLPFPSPGTRCALTAPFHPCRRA